MIRRMRRRWMARRGYVDIDLAPYMPEAVVPESDVEMIVRVTGDGVSRLGMVEWRWEVPEGVVVAAHGTSADPVILHVIVTDLDGGKAAPPCRP